MKGFEKKESYTHTEVEAIINKIIHQDSMGDIFFQAKQTFVNHGMELADPREETEENSVVHDQ